MQVLHERVDTSTVRPLARLPSLVLRAVAVHGLFIQIEYARHAATAAAVIQAGLDRRDGFWIGPREGGHADGTAGFRHAYNIVEAGPDV